MAVAALSTSATPLTAGPAATPPAATGPSGGAATGKAAPAFAQLVAEAKSDDKTGQEAKPDAGGEPDADAAATAVEGGVATASEGEAKDRPADQPVDLLAEIEAMVAAAGQIGVAAPSPAQAVATPVSATPETSTETAAPLTTDAPSTTRPATTAVALPTVALPAAIRKAAALSASATEPPATATAADPVPGAAPPEAETNAASPILADTAVPTGDAPAQAPRGNITALLASLKSAFAPGRAPAAAAPLAPVADGAAAAPMANPAAALPTAPAAAAPVILSTEAVIAEPAGPAKGGKPTRTPAVSSASASASAAAVAIAKTDAAVPQPTPLPASADAALQPTEARRPAAADGTVPEDGTPATTAPTAPLASPAAALDAALAGVRPNQAGSIAATDIAANGTVNQAEMAVDRHLDLAHDNQWLDRLARDISQAATQQGHLKFHLNPERLGALTVEIANSAAGTAIKLTTETDQARAIIADAQPRLIAEVRAQGLRVAETHVELNNQQGNSGSAFTQNPQGQAQQQRQSSADHQPFGRTQATIRDDAGDSAPSEDGELYA
ncbi:flagellar hook-length control protein FliK [Sphingomonadaceae bacterium G21617-S1]|nr:flagellar hook-length control protein FliK [Sphingomonadaceae bacterium G21617-S1]